MKKTTSFFLLLWFSAGIFAQDETLTVTIVHSEPVTGETVIRYELTGNDDFYNISAAVSFDGGDYQSIPGEHISGALTNVTPGIRTLTWDGKASFPETYSEDTRIRITATPTEPVCGEYITFTYRGQEATYGTITRTYTIDDSQVTLCWLDRNLGATRVPEHNEDTEGFGDLFQWGRLDDGHQDRGSNTTDVLSDSDVPGHDDFIKTWWEEPEDWRSPQNWELWRGEEGINNPCPTGWRLPVIEELQAEKDSWTPGDYSGAFDSPLKWLRAGGREAINGLFYGGVTKAYIWSSSLNGFKAQSLEIGSWSDITTIIDDVSRASGRSVRCVKGAAPDPETNQLTLTADPETYGAVSGQGLYEGGQMVSISADAEDTRAFLYWTGDTDYVADPASANTKVTMPQEDISLTAVFCVACGEEITFSYRGSDVTYGTISKTYINGDGEQVTLCWLDRNLGAEGIETFDIATLPGTMTIDSTATFSSGGAEMMVISSGTVALIPVVRSTMMLPGITGS